MFVPSLAGYDVLIHLQPGLVPHCHERVDSTPRLQKLPETPGDEVIPVVEFHPVLKYLEELRVRILNLMVWGLGLDFVRMCFLG